MDIRRSDWGRVYGQTHLTLKPRVLKCTTQLRSITAVGVPIQGTRVRFRSINQRGTTVNSTPSTSLKRILRGIRQIMIHGNTQGHKHLHRLLAEECGSIPALIKSITIGIHGLSIRVSNRVTTMCQVDITTIRGPLGTISSPMISAPGVPTKCHPRHLDIPFRRICSITALGLHRFKYQRLKSRVPTTFHRVNRQQAARLPL